MADKLKSLGPPRTPVLDIGAGYGGAARYLAKASAARSPASTSARSRTSATASSTREQGWSDLITVVHGNFEEMPDTDDSFDVVWSQDAILHSGNREQVLARGRPRAEARRPVRLHRPMQADDCPPGVLQPVSTAFISLAGLVALLSRGGSGAAWPGGSQHPPEPSSCVPTTHRARGAAGALRRDGRGRLDGLCRPHAGRPATGSTPPTRATSPGVSCTSASGDGSHGQAVTARGPAARCAVDSRSTASTIAVASATPLPAMS